MAALAILCGCKDNGSYNEKIVCYSGGTVIYDRKMVDTELWSNGVIKVKALNKKPEYILADCVVTTNE